MADNVLDTKLHTHFAIFLYALQLETAMLTKRVHLDAADAERSVNLIEITSLASPPCSTTPVPNIDADILSVHSSQLNYKFFDHNTTRKENTLEYKPSSTSHG